MPRQHKIVGIITIEDRHDEQWLVDRSRAASIVQLHAMTAPCAAASQATFAATGDRLDRIGARTATAIHADLRQLRTDLQAELRKIVDQLEITA